MNNQNSSTVNSSNNGTQQTENGTNGSNQQTQSSSQSTGQNSFYYRDTQPLKLETYPGK